MIDFITILEKNPNGVIATQDDSKVKMRVFQYLFADENRIYFCRDPLLKTRALEENPPIKAIYKTPDNPIFKIFYIEVEEAETFSFTEGVKKYHF